MLEHQLQEQCSDLTAEYVVICYFYNNMINWSTQIKMHVMQATNKLTILFLSQFQIGEIFTLPKYLPVTYVLISSVSIPRITENCSA